MQLQHPSLPTMDDAAEGLRMTSFSDWFKGYAGACSLGWLDVEKTGHGGVCKF